MRRALAFLTPLPVGAAAPTPATLLWFPVAGALIGLAVGAVWWGGGELFPPLVAAAVAVTADLALTGALHVDGLADTADGLLPHLGGPDERRAVMAAPDVGAFGVAAVTTTLLLRWAAFSSIDPHVLLPAAIWCSSRSLMAAALRTQPYVGGGLGAAFAAGPTRATARPVTVLLVVLGLPAAAGWAVVLLARRRLGGVTGDVLGAAGLAGETVALLVATA